MSTGRMAAVSAAAGTGMGLVIIAALALRSVMAISRRSGGWRDVREFLGIRYGKKERWYTTWML